LRVIRFRLYNSVYASFVYSLSLLLFSRLAKARCRLNSTTYFLSCYFSCPAFSFSNSLRSLSASSSAFCYLKLAVVTYFSYCFLTKASSTSAKRCCSLATESSSFCRFLFNAAFMLAKRSLSLRASCSTTYSACYFRMAATIFFLYFYSSSSF